MEKINYRKQKLDMVRLLRIIASGSEAGALSRRSSRVAESALAGRLELLSRLGIRPKWEAARYEVEEMIGQYELILNSVWCNSI